MAATESLVYNVAYSMLGNPQEAEDMTQEVYVRAWRGLDGFRADSRFTTWLYRIAVNTCLNRRRSLRSDLHVIDRDDALDGIELSRVVSGVDPDALVTRKDLAEALWDAVDALSPKYRTAIALFYQEGLSYDEIADLLSIPLGTVKSHLSRARRALASALHSRREQNHG